MKRCKIKLLFTALLGIILFCARPLFGMEPDSNRQRADEASTCCIFIYMCGSNLESKYGLATENIEELLAADIPDSTTVIIETGGSSRWWSDQGIAADKLQRFIVRDDHLELLAQREGASMGAPETLSAFLRWGRENWSADRNILVIWDHGGKSSEGVCYDENYHYDCLDRSELKSAFEAACLSSPYDLVVLDTCYMASLGVADMFSDFARYMTASQKVIPGAGMDYRVFAEKVSESENEELGKLLCDAYMEKCRKLDREENVQLSFFDLFAAKALVRAVDRGAGQLKNVYELTKSSHLFFNGAMKACVSDDTEDTNLIDLLQFVDNLAYLDWFHDRDAIRGCVADLIRYQVCGETAGCNGVSVFFPLRYRADEVNAYVHTGPAENYSTLLRDIYLDLPEETISFADPGSSRDGSFQMELDEASRPYLRDIVCRVWQESEYIPDYYLMLMDEEVETFYTSLGRRRADLLIRTAFEGNAPALDGHLLFSSVSSRLRLAVYSAPVMVNGEDTWYTCVLSRRFGRKKLLYTTLGNGTDELGLPERNVRKLRPGDIVMTYAAADEKGKKLTGHEKFMIGEDGGDLGEVPLRPGRYRCQYIVTDIIGRTFESDYAIYEITENEGKREVRLTEVQKKGGETNE